ncbi:MAG: NADPH-dependent assimilatory sulfite reductase hemoprotein subunit [Gemmatimonadota bacterium]
MSQGKPQPERPEVDRSRDRSRPLDELHPNESMKATSGALRGSITESLADPITGALQGKDPELTKFHGIYQQDDRDERDERRRRKLEPAHEFMVRVRLPGGVCTPDQWLTLDEVARTHANGTLRLTTRQTFQFHGVLKGALRPTVQGIHRALLDSIGACGDVNRGVMATPLPELDAIHRQLQAIAQGVSEHLLPRSRAYHEIWLDGESVAGGEVEEEPIYGRTYLPRKFKIGFAVPPVNDVDVFTQDIGFIAIARGETLAGFNVVVGGGMGRTDNEPLTYPRLGDVIGFVAADRAIEVAEAILMIQRDFGDRIDRKVARMKYTIDRHGLDWFVGELEVRLGWKLDEVRPWRFETSQDRFGWSRNADGSWNYTVFVENGRVKDAEGHRTMTGLRELARVHQGDLRITPNQNLIVARIPEGCRDAVAALLEDHGIRAVTDRSNVRRHSMACVAFPTCPLAMAESERYFPELLTKVEALLDQVGLGDAALVMRMSGCNNGCSRPYVAEVGFSGRGPGRYNMYLGGGFHGERLNAPYLENVGEETILARLRELFGAYAQGRDEGEPFGDYLIRAGHIREVTAGRDFND